MTSSDTQDALPYGARNSLRGLLRAYLDGCGSDGPRRSDGLGEATRTAGWLVATRYGLRRPAPVLRDWEANHAACAVVKEEAARLEDQQVLWQPQMPTLVSAAARLAGITFDGPPRATVLCGRSAFATQNSDAVHQVLVRLARTDRGTQLGYDHLQANGVYHLFTEAPSASAALVADRLLHAVHEARGKDILLPATQAEAAAALAGTLAKEDGARPSPAVWDWVTLFGQGARFFVACRDPQQPWETGRTMMVPGYVGRCTGAIAVGRARVGLELRHWGGMAD